MGWIAERSSLSTVVAACRSWYAERSDAEQSFPRRTMLSLSNGPCEVVHTECLLNVERSDCQVILSPSSTDVEYLAMPSTPVAEYCAEYLWVPSARVRRALLQPSAS